mgnify:CR=1 FL=1
MIVLLIKCCPVKNGANRRFKMIDFILVSLPWIVIGVTIAVIITFLTKRKKK